MAIPAGIRVALHARAHDCCEVCGQPGATNAHHRLNRSQGGPDTLDNLLLVCGSGTTGCHGWITEHPDKAAAYGYTVRYGNDPAKVPVVRWSREFACIQWVLLDADGGLGHTPKRTPE